MAVTQGMNVEEVERLGAQLQRSAQDIDTWTASIDRLVVGTPWMGSDADRFKHEWWPGHRARIRSVAGELNGYGQSALNNASEQRRASGEAGATEGKGPATDGGGGSGTAPDSQSPGTGGPTGLNVNESEEGLRARFRAQYARVNGDFDRYNTAYNSAGNCTSYAAWRVNDIADQSGHGDWSFSNNNIGDVNGLRMGNGYEWGQSASAAGFPPNQDASVGSVAWWNGSTPLGEYGHVAVVHSVDANSITVEEGSWGSADVRLTTYARGDARFPTGFLHLAPGT